MEDVQAQLREVRAKLQQSINRYEGELAKPAADRDQPFIEHVARLEQKEARLEQKEVLLLQQLSQPITPRWAQVDGTSLVTRRTHLYVTAILMNDRADPPIQCRMRLMVDTGSDLPLVIPLRKARQLKLLERSRTTAEGYGGAVVNMIVFAPILIKLPATSQHGAEQIFKQADIAPCSADVPYDDGGQEISQFAGFRQLLSDDGSLQLSPVSSPRENSMPEAIVGMRGLEALRLSVDAEHSRLLPVVTPYIVV